MGIFSRLLYVKMNFQWVLSWLLHINREKGYLLPTWVQKITFRLNSPVVIRANLQITFLSIIVCMWFDSTRYIYISHQKAAELLHLNLKQSLTKCFMSCTYYSHILIFHCHFQQLTYSVRWRIVLRLLMHKKVTSLQRFIALLTVGYYTNTH